MDTQLTFRQERFVFEYLKDQNASAAAARAGYTARNMAAQGNELMSNPAVRERVRMEMQSLLAEVECSMLELIKQRKRAAFFRAGNMLRGWDLLALDEMDEETRRAVEVVTVLRKSGPEVRVKSPNRDRALRALERVHERLDQLNERRYAQLEREGEIRRPEEVERKADERARADAEATARDISEKCPERNPLGGPQVLSGSEAGVETRVSPFSEKPQVLSGSTVKVETGGARFPEKCPERNSLGGPMVLSGSAVIRKMPIADISKKCPERKPLGGPQVLSGSKTSRLAPLVAAMCGSVFRKRAAEAGNARRAAAPA